MGLSKAAKGWLVWGLTAWAAIGLAAGPADAKRKFSFGGSSSSKSSPSAPSGAGKAAPPAKMSALDMAIIGMQVQRATSNKLRKLFDLPPSKFNTLPDGRHFHIGEVTRFLLGGRYVGWVGRGEFLELKPEHLQAVLSTAGFDTVAAFEAHLVKAAVAKNGGGGADAGAGAGAGADSAAATPDGAAPTAQDYSQTQLGVLAAGCLLLLGFFGFCFVSWRKNRDSEAKPVAAAVAGDRRARIVTPSARGASAGAVPASRVARPVQAFASQPRRAAVPAAVPAFDSRSSQQTAAVLPRRAPRDLSALTRKPRPA